MKAQLLVAILFISNFMFSQTSIDFDERLLERFTVEELTDMKNNNADQLKVYEYCLDHAYYFVDKPIGKPYKERITSEVIINDIENFNFFKLDITPLEHDYQYFSVKNKNVLLVVKSGNHIFEEMK